MEIIATGLSFPEGPRWRDGKLYFSDFYHQAVYAMDSAGTLEVVAEVPTQPSGLGWTPDGRLMIVSMLDRRLLRQQADGTLAVHADLGAIATWHCNDMVVDSQGRAYVGNFGWDYQGPGEPLAARLALVEPDGGVRVAASDLLFPNGSVITPDGSTLVIAETFANRLTAFDIDDAGDLSGRRVWADLAGRYPDGICMDAEGAVWVADAGGGSVLRVMEGGQITERIDVGRGTYACMLGGEDGRTLYVCTSEAPDANPAANPIGRIECVRVGVPHAGLP